MATVLREDNQQATVTRLLRCENTRRYFTGDGWTENSAEAAHFPDEMAAVHVCIERRLVNVELVLRFEDADIFSARIR
jgi:hypothetical protein